MISPVPRHFLPSAERGRAVDAAMHAALEESLAHISERCVQDFPEISRAMEAPLGILASGGRIPPSGFAQYFDLGQCLLEGEFVGASNAACALSSSLPRSHGICFHRRGSDEARDLDFIFDKRMGDGASRYCTVAAPVFTEFCVLFQEGINLLKSGFPDLHGEVSAILSDLLVAQAPEGAVMEFDGASHYQFWGLLLLNPKHHRTPLAVAEVVAHEVGHSLLFGLTIEEPLVLNPDEELYKSPLRVDPRPMDGIYHATFVSARMALAMETLAGSGLLTPQEKDLALRAAKKDRENFEMGHATVMKHGRLSGPGEEILENAREWVDGR
jgi:hypothetical protein